ncbi:MAG: NUDIX domain-containing protein [Pseudomonadota bacterium]
MKRILTILRHGEAETYNPGGDAVRQLTEKGKLDAFRVGAFLGQSELYPDRIEVSSAIRAVSTAEKMHKSMLPDRKPAFIINPGLYNAPLETLTDIVAQQSDDAHHVMIVGHNPGLTSLINQIAGQDLRAKRIFPSLAPASLAIIEGDGPWRDLAAGAGRVVQLKDAWQLPQDFPWPDNKGTERRERPDYFYRQSSVIPYRISKNGKIEILLVMSGSGKNLVIPKGAIEPGMNASESAAKEALEEAGAIGTPAPTPIGRYEYDKWGAPCTVEVFAMPVDRLLPEKQWEESFRTRKWYGGAAAVEAIKRDGLKDILNRFIQDAPLRKPS